MKGEMSAYADTIKSFVGCDATWSYANFRQFIHQKAQAEGWPRQDYPTDVLIDQYATTKISTLPSVVESWINANKTPFRNISWLSRRNKHHLKNFVTGQSKQSSIVAGTLEGFAS